MTAGGGLRRRIAQGASGLHFKGEGHGAPLQPLRLFVTLTTHLTRKTWKDDHRWHRLSFLHKAISMRTCALQTLDRAKYCRWHVLSSVSTTRAAHVCTCISSPHILTKLRRNRQLWSAAATEHLEQKQHTDYRRRSAHQQ